MDLRHVGREAAGLGTGLIEREEREDGLPDFAAVEDTAPGENHTDLEFGHDAECGASRPAGNA